MQELDFSFIGKRLREIRKYKNLTQEQLAEGVGVNVSHISNIENNRVKVSLTLLVKMCNALGVSVDYLLMNEYFSPNTALETELYNAVKGMTREKKELLLKIAKAI